MDILIVVVLVVLFVGGIPALLFLCSRQTEMEVAEQQKRRKDVLVNKGAMQLSKSSKALFICRKCGNTTSTPKELGSGMGCAVWLIIGILSVFFAFFAIVALVGIVIAAIGLVASFSGRKKLVCPHCGQTDCLIPSDSPEGDRIINRYKGSSTDEEQFKKHNDDAEERLAKITMLRERGIITGNEYDEQRKRILESL